ncbi:hypothetical protein CMI40_00815 [Candidatus Pacearchaeota archaeon]|jgi:hypothetical protein|nr:hypothetical protein [Candidatus Pacearchaeota archaeon]|tara:strand:- start:12114 stop:16409 length:4296 start_codon:yes stop_codon:yes gene_type:complete
MGLGVRKVLFISIIALILFISSVSADIIITEIMYSPNSTLQGSNSNLEWIELYNNGSSIVDLSNWTLEENAFDDINISVGEYIIIARDLNDSNSDNESFESYYGNNDSVWNSTDASWNASDGGMTLSNSGEIVNLTNGSSTYTVNYTNFISFAAEDGKTLIWYDANWTSSKYINGTPGSANDEWVPTISNVTNYTNDGTINMDDNVTLNSTIIDVSNISAVWIEGNWNGSYVNYTLNPIGNNNYTYTINSGNFSNPQTINYRWYSNDTLGNIANSSLISFSIANRNPVINIPSTIIINESGSTTFNLTSNITDADSDVLTISISSVNTTKLNVTINSDNTTLYINTTNNDWYGLGTFIITAIDTNLGTDILGITVNISSVNDFPTINFSAGTWNQSKNEDNESWTVNLTSFKTDVDSEDTGSNLTLRVITYNTSLINVSINSTTNILNLTTIANQHGTTNLQLNITDSHNATTNVTMLVNISSINDLPLINQTIANQSVADNSQLNLNLTNFCDDSNDTNTNLNWSVKDQNTTLWNSILVVNDIIAFQPNSNVNPMLSNKTDPLNITCTDGAANATQQITITITPFNDAPAQVNDTSRTPINNSNQTSATNVFTLSWSNSSDSENQTLTYFIFFGNTTNPSQNGSSTTSQFNVSNLAANTTYYWLIVANDGVKNSSNSSLFQFTTNFDNSPNITIHAPSTNKTISENQTLVFNATIFDSDGNNITYNWTVDGIQNLSATTTTNNATISFNYTPLFNESGTHTIKLAIKDTNNNSGNSRSWLITVSNNNRIPTLNTISSQSVNEDATLTFNITGSDPDSNTLTYGSNLSSITITKTNNTLASASFTPTNSNVGTNYVNFTLSDGTITVSQVVTITVSNTNDAPTISSSSPSSNPTIKNGTSQLFSVSTSDPDGNTLTTTWYVNGSSSGTGTSLNLTKTTLKTSEIFNITAIVSDGTTTTSRAWDLTVASVPFSSNFTSSETTNVSSISNLSQSTNIILANTQGKISFGSQALDLSNVFDLDSYVKITNGIVAINTTKYSQLNKSATITLTGLTYTTIPKILYNSGFTTTASEITSECSFCNVTSYTSPTTTSGVVVFTVDHFSSFKIVGSGKKFDVDSFDDLDTCEDGEQGNLSISVKDPDDGDDFKPEEEIEIDVKVTNNGDDDKRIVVESILYNINEDDEEESDKSDSEKVKEDENENFDLVIDVPNNFDDGDDYIIFIKAYEKGEEDTQCNFEIIDIDLEREDHDVIVEDVSLLPLINSPGGSIEVIVDVENVGGKDEDDVYIELTENILGISEKSELFDIEKSGDDDTFSESFFIKIPENANKGDYDLNIKVVFDDGSDSKSETFSVVSQELLSISAIILTSETRKDGIISLTPATGEISEIKEKTTTISSPKRTVSPKSSNAYITISIILVIAIILLIGLIIWFARK